MSEPEDARSTTPFGLLSLGGEPAPPGLGTDLRHLETLPESVHEAFWELLEPNLAPTLDARLEALVDDFCRRHGVARADLVPPVRGCRLLFVQGALRDVSIEAMAQDLRLLGVQSPIARTLLSAYRKAFPLLRVGRLLQTLGDFGPVLDDIKLRLDIVPASQHLAQGVGIALLSLGYREGGERKRLTLQVPAQLLAQLRSALGSLAERR